MEEIHLSEGHLELFQQSRLVMEGMLSLACTVAIDGNLDQVAFQRFQPNQWTHSTIACMGREEDRWGDNTPTLFGPRRLKKQKC